MIRNIGEQTEAETILQFGSASKEVVKLEYEVDNLSPRPARPKRPGGSRTGKRKGVEEAGKSQYKGVRMRSWGSWVSEIRAPNQKTRIWLGSYSTPEAAARAYDAALICLKGRSASLNFPDSAVDHPGPVSPRSIQRIAAAAANRAPNSFDLVSTGEEEDIKPPMALQKEESSGTTTVVEDYCVSCSSSAWMDQESAQQMFSPRASGFDLGSGMLPTSSFCGNWVAEECSDHDQELTRLWSFT